MPSHQVLGVVGPRTGLVGSDKQCERESPSDAPPTEQYAKLPGTLQMQTWWKSENFFFLGALDINDVMLQVICKVPKRSPV